MVRFTVLGLLLAVAAAGCGPSADLRLRSLECGSPFGESLLSANGAVENISSQSLHGIVAVVTLRRNDDSIAETLRARIYGPLRPGGTSRFHGSIFSSSKAARCEVAFTDEAGRTIPHVVGSFRLWTSRRSSGAV